MAREDHQPAEIIAERPARSEEQFRDMCGRTVAVIVATEMGTTPLFVMYDEPDRKPVVCAPKEGEAPVPRPLQSYEGKPAVQWAIETALESQVEAVYVLAAPEVSAQIAQAADAAIKAVGKRNFQAVSVVDYDKVEGAEESLRAASFQLFDLSFAQLSAGARLAGSHADCESVIFLPCDVVRLKPDHIYELCEDLQAHPGTQAVASWIVWLRRPPYLFERSFLDEITSGESALTHPLENGHDRPVPQLSVRDHVFGEEKIAANAVQDERVQEFFEGCTMTALQAVRLAKWSLAHPDEELHSPNQPLSLIGPVTPKPLSEADAQLVQAAKKAIADLEGASRGYADALEWADAFGQNAKRDFPLLNDREHAGKLVYLDSAATAQRVDVALQAQRDYDVHENANVYRGAYKLSAQSTFTFNDARKVMEDFIGAERRTTAYTANTTASCNLVAQAWGEHHIGEGDLIVTTIAEHHSNMLPFAQLAERKGAQIEYVGLDAGGRIDRDAFEKALTKKPKLVCIAHVGNTMGIVEPMEQMVAAAHEAGARILVDAAQSFAHRKLNVKELGADWVAFSGHKAYGPMGIGGLWISDEAFAEMDPLGGGGGTVSHVSTESYYLRPKVIQYELGTPPVSQAVGLAAAIRYLDELGMENVARHDAALTRLLVDGMHSIEGITIVGDHSCDDGLVGLVSFTVLGSTPDELAAFMGGLDVAIRSGGHCALPLHASLGLVGTGRISLGVYTTREDIEAACTVLVLLRTLKPGA